MKQTDNILLSLLKKGNKNAFDTLFKKYATRLYFFSLNFFTKEDAEEIVQDTFVKIWETRDKIDVTQHFNTYLITIAKHLIYNHFRHKVVEQKYNKYILQTSCDFYSIEHELILKNLKEHIIASIEQLSPQQKEIILLKYNGYDNQSIAEQLHLSKRTVETHINKAFKILRLYLMRK
jgi:RNA polymerase sigma-70 factor (ECF subfamily)